MLGRDARRLEPKMAPALRSIQAIGSNADLHKVGRSVCSVKPAGGPVFGPGDECELVERLLISAQAHFEGGHAVRGCRHDALRSLI
jgi:hypothetical protein